ISESRAAACRYYNERLSRIRELLVPQTDFQDITPFLYYVRVPRDKRGALRSYLADRGIETGVHWQPGHWFTLLRDYRRGDLSVTDRVGREVLSLPLHPKMKTETLDRVVAGIQDFFEAR